MRVGGHRKIIPDRIRRRRSKVSSTRRGSTPVVEARKGSIEQQPVDEVIFRPLVSNQS